MSTVLVGLSGLLMICKLYLLARIRSDSWLVGRLTESTFFLRSCCSSLALCLVSSPVARWHGTARAVHWLLWFLWCETHIFFNSLLGIDIGCFLKRFSIDEKKKCKKKWRWPGREMKIWYKYNNNVVFIFAWKYFSNHDLFGWYGLSNV